MPQKNYLSAIETLNSFQNVRLTQSHGSTDPKHNKLGAMVKFLDRCGIPLEKIDNLPIIHVTGTHGKGSTCFYCESILQNHGYKTGFYSSPHLLEVRERIRINEKPISKSLFSKHFWEVHDMLNRKEYDDEMPKYFPFLTILAFYIFLKSDIDVAIVEVGIGGEFDCTNIIRNPVAVGISPISIDHTDILGTSEESIAWNKAGIMKPGSVAFSVTQQESVLNVLRERSKERNCALKILENNRYTTVDDRTNVPIHVKETIGSLAMALSEEFIKKKGSDGNGRSVTFSSELAIRSIENACWPGRYDVRKIDNIRFFLDGAHTQNSIKTTSEWYSDKTKGSKAAKVLIFNLTGNRQPDVFFKELITCEFDVGLFIPNIGYDNETADTTNFKLTTDMQLVLCEQYKGKWVKLQEEAGRQSSTVKVLPSFAKALNFLGSTKEYDVLVTGSLYLVGAALSVLDPTLSGALDDQ